MKNIHISNVNNILKNCGNVMSSDKLLIISDRTTSKILKYFLNEALKLTSNIFHYKINVQQNHGSKISQKLEKLMLKSTIIVALTKFSLAHTKARIQAAKAGARFLSLPDYDFKLINNPSLSVDFKKYNVEAKKISRLLSNSNKIHVTSKLGTNLKIYVNKRISNCCPGFVNGPGDLGSPPDIEVNISPIETRSHGRLVIDGSVTHPSIKLLSDPIIILINNGKITKFYTKNKKNHEQLKKIFEKKNNKRKILAEFGIGLNHKAHLTGKMLTDEGCRGCVHFGFGSNITVGGQNDINFHIDFVMKKANVYIDKKYFIKNGKIQKKIF